jgi:hypothetical protein
MTSAIVSLLLLFAQPPADPVRAALGQLTGDWTGAGTGTPGEATGGFSFRPDLQGLIIIRRNYAEYPAAKDRPAFRHDDLMIFHRQASQGPWQADYYDNEGHVIRYAVSAEAGKLVCLSEPSANAPRFRFTYTIDSPQTLKLKFEIAPPGKPDAFSTYIEASARRAKSN